MIKSAFLKATTMMVALIAGSSAALANCKTYAITAAKQQQINETQNCGFTGPYWTKDLKVHIDYCSSVSPTQWRAKLAERQKQLDTCSG